MNIEELKLVLSTIQGIASTAGWVGLAWVVLHYVTLFLTAAVTPVAVGVCIVKVVRYFAEAYKAPQIHQRQVKVDGFVINEDVWLKLKTFLLEEVGTGIYVHESHVNKLRDAWKDRK